MGELLKRLLDEHAITVGPLFGDTGNAAGELTKYRNYIVHRSPELEGNSTFGRDLYWLTQKLMFLMKACLLTELGIPAEQQLALFRRNQMYAHLLSLPVG